MSGTTDEGPTLAEISAFLAVVDSGSFSAAASTMGVAKSSISRRVAALEARLDARLLRRTTRRLALTEIGTVYYNEVSRAMESMRGAADTVRQLHEVPAGALRISAPVDFGSALGELCAEFAQTHPQVSLEVSMTQRAVDLIGEGYDLAFRAGKLVDSSLIARKLLDTELLLLASPAYLEQAGTPTHPEQLPEHRFVAFGVKGGRQRLEFEGPEGRHEVVVKGQLAANEFNLIRAALLADAGIGVAPDTSVAPLIKQGRLVRLLTRWTLPTGGLYIVYSSRSYLPAKLRAFRDFATRWFHDWQDSVQPS